MKFEIPLAEQKVKPHQVTALHLVTGFALLALSALGLLVNNTIMTLPGSAPIDIQKVSIQEFDSVDTALSVIMAISILILGAAMFRNKWLRRPGINKIFRVIELLIITTISIYLLSLQLNVPAALFGLLAATIVFSLFWEGSNNKNITIIFSEEGIRLPITSRRRSISWDEAEKVILRHGTVTINCTDNRMYQWVTAQQDTDPAAFEAFCYAMIETKRKDRKNDW